ncbi:hypothetical protein ACSLBF_19845 (plasmid) [Pseudoalteromonas sp. T1lg65]|uniref:hypothetical protein n=1 Tax=Pseudoalteromonas sp. T1lg65 TaxID=2077101 RepID=UPI003F7ADE9B
MQRTLKHSEWLKIAESRTRPSRTGKKARTKPNFKIRFAAILGVLFLTWCVISNSNPEKQLASFSKQQERLVARHFAKQYAIGSWQYSHLNTTPGEVHVYIKIPTKLALNDTEMQRYIKQSLCPTQSSTVWSAVADYSLYLHLFVDSPRTGEYAQC